MGTVACTAEMAYAPYFLLPSPDYSTLSQEALDVIQGPHRALDSHTSELALACELNLICIHALKN